MTDKRISLLVFLPHLSVGGAERVVVTLLKNLDRSRFDPTLVVIGDDKGPLTKDLPADLETIFLFKKRVRASILDIIALSRTRKPDIVFLGLSYLNLFVSMFRWVLPKTTSVIGRETNVISLNNSQYKLTALWGLLYRIFYRRLDHVICQSQVMQQDLLEAFAMPAERTSVIGNPVDIAAIRKLALQGQRETAKELEPKRPHLVAVSGLRPEKNLDGLVRGLALASNKNISLEIVGDGPERTRLLALVSELRLESRVIFVGFEANPYPLMAQCDALILASHNEGLPNVLLEALALGRPVIATPAGGVSRELLSGKKGCTLAASSSPEDIAIAIDRWEKTTPVKVDPDIVMEFELQDIVQQYENLFFKLSR